MTYRRIATCVLAALLAGCATAGPPEIAITVDDMPVHGGVPPGETRLAITRSLVSAFAAARAPAHGFVNAAGVAQAPDGAAALEAWAAAGLPLDNHTFSHPMLETTATQAYLDDIARNEAPLRRLARGRAPRWFRYPYLSEASDPAKREAVRAWLGARGYRVAAVTMDFADYAWNDAYLRCVARGDAAAVAGLEASFLRAAQVEAQRARTLSRALLKRDVRYVLLLHLGAFDARMMPRLLALYRDLGFRFVTLERAQADPFYAAANDLARPGPTPRLDTLAATAGHAVPPRAPLPETACAG